MYIRCNVTMIHTVTSQSTAVQWVAAARNVGSAGAVGLTEFIQVRGKLRVITKGQDRARNGCHLWR